MSHRPSRDRLHHVFTTYLIVTTITIVATAAIAIAGLRRVEFVVTNMAEVAVPGAWLPLLAALKAAGAVGLLLGILGVVLGVPILSTLGVAAAAGLVLFFTGALLTHLRARVFHNLHFPGTFWLLATASLMATLAVV